jgi:uncharacterized membrane protein YkoI
MSIRAFILGVALLSDSVPTVAAAQSYGSPYSWGGYGLGLQQRRGGDSLGAGWRGQQQDEARDRVRGGELVPLPRVLESIRRRTPGRHLDTGLEDEGGRPVYRVRWAANDGRRIDYLVDARTGAVLRADGE